MQQSIKYLPKSDRLATKVDLMTSINFWNFLKNEPKKI